MFHEGRFWHSLNYTVWGSEPATFTQVCHSIYDISLNGNCRIWILDLIQRGIPAVWNLKAFRDTKWFILHSCSKSQAAALEAALSSPAQYQSTRVMQRDRNQYSNIFHHGVIRAVPQCQGAFSYNAHNLRIRLSNPGMEESC